MATVVPSRSSHTSNMAETAQKPSLTWCQPCGERLLELKRQALKFLMIEYHKLVMLSPIVPAQVGPLFYSVYEQLRLPDFHKIGLENEQCDNCGTYIETLKRQAIHAIQSVNIAPFLPRSVMYALGQPQERTMPVQPRWQNNHVVVNGSQNGSAVGMSGPDSPKKTAGKQEMSNGSLNMDEARRRRRVMGEADENMDIPAAALFFAKAAQKFNIPTKKKTKRTVSRLLNRDSNRLQYDIQEEREEKALFPTNFADLIEVTPPQKPPGLYKYMGRRVDGKVKVMLRVAQGSEHGEEGESFLKIDQRRRQVTIVEPRIPQDGMIRGINHTPGPPKMFAFDAIFEPPASQHEITSTALLDVLHAVINGGDGSLIVYGGSDLGKTDTMVGTDDSLKSVGAIPCAITWLYNLIEDSKQRTGARFSVRVSAVEIVGRSENLKDLLAEQASGGSSTSSSGTSPGIYLREDPICGVQLSNVSELRAPTAEKASFYLDAALAARTTVPNDADGSVDITECQGSHMIYTLHVYQYRIDKGSRSEVHGGRSRLYLIDLSAWERGAFRDCLSHSAPSQGSLGAVIVAMLNGMKQYPYRDSKITRLLKDSIGNMACRTTVVAHVSPNQDRFSETLSTMQMAAKIHRSRRKRNKISMCSSSNDSSCDERFGRRRPTPAAVLTYGIDDNGNFEPSASDYTSSAGEESCDTVIYVASNGRGSDIDFTDNEGPPDFLKDSRNDNLEIDKRAKVSTEPNCNTSEQIRRSPLPRPGSGTPSGSTGNQRILTPSTLERMRAETLSIEKIDVHVPDYPVHPTTSSPDFLPQVSTRDNNAVDARAVEEARVSHCEVISRVVDYKQPKGGCAEKESYEFGNKISLPSVKVEGNQESHENDVFDDDCPEDKPQEQSLVVVIEDAENISLSVEPPRQQKFTPAENVIVEQAPFQPLSEHQVINNGGLVRYEEDEEDNQYVTVGSITEKELRKKEKRLKKLLKEKMKHQKIGKRNDSDNLQNIRTEGDTSCFSDQEENVRKTSNEYRRKVSNDGYFSAPETSDSRSKYTRQTLDRAGLDKYWKLGTAKDSSESKDRKSSIEYTKNILKNFVAMKLEEKRLSSSASEDSHSVGRSDILSPVECPPVQAEETSSVVLTPCVARLQYVKSNTASITSTKSYKGSVLSLSSESANCPLTSTRNRSESQDTQTQEKMSEDSVSILSETDSTISTDLVPRRRGPAKICYRWSTVYEEEEKAKQKSKSPKSQANRTDTDTPKELSPKGKSKKSKESKSPKKESKSPKKGNKSSNTISSSQVHETRSDHPGSPPPVSPVLSARCSVSMYSDSSSGIVSNAASDLSQQSLPGSSVTPSPARDESLLRPDDPGPLSPRSRRWFFGREKKSKSRHHSGYVSDGSLTDSSRTSRRSRGFFGSKSRLSSQGHSSGYESMRTDGGLTSNTSGNESAGEGGSTKRKKRRFLGFRRRSTSDLSRKGRSKGSYWIDNTAIFSDSEDIEYKLYNIEDIDGMVPGPRARSDSEPTGGLNGQQARLLETHRKRVLELRRQREKLAAELDQAMEKLMLDKDRYKVTGSVRSNPDHPHYANELEREVGLFHRRLRVLKAHLEMITCFDRLKFHRCTSI